MSRRRRYVTTSVDVKGIRYVASCQVAYKHLTSVVVSGDTRYAYVEHWQVIKDFLVQSMAGTRNLDSSRNSLTNREIREIVDTAVMQRGRWSVAYTNSIFPLMQQGNVRTEGRMKGRTDKLTEVRDSVKNHSTF